MQSSKGGLAKGRIIHLLHIMSREHSTDIFSLDNLGRPREQLSDYEILVQSLVTHEGIKRSPLIIPLAQEKVPNVHLDIIVIDDPRFHNNHVVNTIRWRGNDIGIQDYLNGRLINYPTSRKFGSSFECLPPHFETNRGDEFGIPAFEFRHKGMHQSREGMFYTDPDIQSQVSHKIHQLSHDILSFLHLTKKARYHPQHRQRVA